MRWLQAAADQLELPALNRWGLERREVPALAGQALTSSSMKANPVALSRQALERAIGRALETER